MNAAVHIKKHEDQLRQTIHDLCIQITKCTDVDGGIFENLLCTVPNLSFKHKIKIKLKLTESNLSFFITVHNDFVFVHSNVSISVTIQNYAHVHTNFYVSQLLMLSALKILTFPPESPCRLMPTFLKNVLPPTLGSLDYIPVYTK